MFNFMLVLFFQVGFIDYILHPMWETWADLVYPDAQEILDQVEENRDWFQSMIPISPSSSFCSSAKSEEKSADSKFQFDIEEEKDSENDTEHRGSDVVIKLTDSGNGSSKQQNKKGQ
jgi:cAMP-specific phosphodiesterase 4